MQRQRLIAQLTTQGSSQENAEHLLAVLAQRQQQQIQVLPLSCCILARVRIIRVNPFCSDAFSACALACVQRCIAAVATLQPGPASPVLRSSFRVMNEKSNGGI